MHYVHFARVLHAAGALCIMFFARALHAAGALCIMFTLLVRCMLRTGLCVGRRQQCNKHHLCATALFEHILS